MPDPLVRFELHSESIGKITLYDPDRLNAMGEDMARDFKRVVADLKGNQKIRVLILTGAGRAFSAGGDLQMLEKKTELSGEENRRRMLEYYHSFLGVLDLKLPIIAAINGHAIGAGLCVAAACDVRICAEKAKLGLTFTRLGLHPGMGATYFLPRVIGHAAASELMLSGKVIDAGEALRLGLVSKLVAADRIIAESEAIANEILSCGPEATTQLLESLRSGPRTMNQALEREALAQGINYASADFKEGVRALIEKRTANFSS